MLEAAVERANALLGIDFVVEGVSGDEIVIASFNDDPPPAGRALCRLKFGSVFYVQMPWQFSHRKIAVRSLSAFQLPSRDKPWVTPFGASEATLSAMPSLTVDDAHQALSEGFSVFVFHDLRGDPIGPEFYLLARTLSVHST
jgi:hypothetical protein